MSHRFSRIAAAGQLSSDFLTALPAAAPAEPLPPATSAPVDFASQAAAVAVLPAASPVPHRETLFEFLVRHGKLEAHTKAALKRSNIGRAMTDDCLRDDLAQAAHIRWTEMQVNPSHDDRQVFALAALSAPQAIQKVARRTTGAVYVPAPRRDYAGEAYAALVTATRQPFDIDDWVDSSELSAEDEYLDRPDADFIDRRLAVLDINATPVMRRIAELMLLEGVVDAAALTERLSLPLRSTQRAIALLLAAFDRANARHLQLAA